MHNNSIKNELMPVVIGSNCCGANFYHHCLNIPFYSPFIWSTVPYDSLYYLVQNWPSINWYKIKLIPNNERPYTLTLIIDNIIKVHYVHYIFSPTHTTPYTHGANVYYKDIHLYLLQKYKERVNRMLTYGDIKNPKFLIHEELFGNKSTHSYVDKLFNMQSPYQRVFVTYSNTDYRLPQNSMAQNLLYIHDETCKLPQPMIEKYGNRLARFFGVSSKSHDSDLSWQ